MTRMEPAKERPYPNSSDELAEGSEMVVPYVQTGGLAFVQDHVSTLPWLLL